MHLLYRRYSRSGIAPKWFYATTALGFGVLGVWALVRGDWLVSALAITMVAVTGGGSTLMRRLISSGDHAARSGAGHDEEHMEDDDGR